MTMDVLRHKNSLLAIRCLFLSIAKFIANFFSFVKLANRNFIDLTSSSLIQR